MNYEIEKITTQTGMTRHQLRVWNFGPERKEFKRRYADKKLLFAELDTFQKDHEFLIAGGKPQNEIMFGFLHFDWRRRKANHYSPSWGKTTWGFWKELRPKVSRLPYTRVNPDFLRSLEAELLRGGNSQRTVNLKIMMLYGVLNFAVEMGKIPLNPAAKFKKKKPAAAEIPFWEREDAEDFLYFVGTKYPRGTDKRWIYCVYLVGINAALRAGEIWAIRPRNLKPSMGVIRIEEQWNNVKRDFMPVKGKEPRNVPLNAAVLAELQDWIDVNRIGRNELIFQSEAGGAIDHNNFYKRVFVRDLAEWNGPRINIHGLRHTGATLMLGAGVDLKTVSNILGHKDLKTTGRYLHILSSSVKAAAEIFSVTPKGNPKLSIVRPSSS